MHVAQGVKHPAQRNGAVPRGALGSRAMEISRRNAGSACPKADGISHRTGETVFWL